MSAEHITSPQPPEVSDLMYLATAFGPGATFVEICPPDQSLQRRVTLGEPPDNFGPLSSQRFLADADMVGVELGNNSGLLALGFPSEAAVKELFANNTELSKTLITRYGTYYVVWLQAVNSLPPTKNLSGISINTDEVIPIYTRKGAPGPCSIHHRGSILKVDLRQIHFTGDVRDYFTKWLLQERYGPALFKTGTRKGQLNPNYWAGLFAKNGTRYNPATGLFCVPGPDGGADLIVTPENMVLVISNILTTQNTIPPQELRPCRLRAILEAIQIFTAISPVNTAAVMQQFVRSRLEACKGASVTMGQIADAFRLYGQTRGVPAGSDKITHRELAKAITSHHGLYRSHDILVNGMPRRGYHGLALRSAPTEDVIPQSTTAPKPGTTSASLSSIQPTNFQI